MPVHDHVFCLRGPDGEVWKAIVAGKIIKAEWPDRGSARAGMQSEQRRQIVAKRKEQNDG